MLEQMRRAQSALGDLNDVVQAPIKGAVRLKAKTRKRLLSDAESAYRALASLA